MANTRGPRACVSGYRKRTRIRTGDLGVGKGDGSDRWRSACVWRAISGSQQRMGTLSVFFTLFFGRTDTGTGHGDGERRSASVQCAG